MYDKNSPVRNNLFYMKSIEEITQIWEFVFKQMMDFGIIENQNSDMLANEFISPIFFFRMKLFLAQTSSEKKKIKKDISNHINFFTNIISK